MVLFSISCDHKDDKMVDCENKSVVHLVWQNSQAFHVVIIIIATNIPAGSHICFNNLTVVLL